MVVRLATTGEMAPYCADWHRSGLSREPGPESVRPCSLECGIENLTTVPTEAGLVRNGACNGMGYINGDYLWYVTGGGAYANVQNIRDLLM